MPSLPNEPEREDLPDSEGGPRIQESFRRIYFGQLSEPLIPEPHPPSDLPEDELTRAAMEDPAALDIEYADPRPTTWRWVFLLLLAVGALGIVFWKH